MKGVALILLLIDLAMASPVQAESLLQCRPRNGHERHATLEDDGANYVLKLYDYDAPNERHQAILGHFGVTISSRTAATLAFAFPKTVDGKSTCQFHELDDHPEFSCSVPRQDRPSGSFSVYQILQQPSGRAVLTKVGEAEFSSIAVSLFRQTRTLPGNRESILFPLEIAVYSGFQHGGGLFIDNRIDSRITYNVGGCRR